MRQVVDVVRTRKVYNMSLDEFLKGEWVKNLPNSELLEVQYKDHFLTVSDAKISKIKRAEMAGGDEHGRNKSKGSYEHRR